MYMKVSRLVFGLATVGTLSFAGFLILYWQKKKRQKSIEEHLKGGGNRKQGKKPLSTSLPPRTAGGDAGGATTAVEGDSAEQGRLKKALLKEALENTESAAGPSLSGDRVMQERSIGLDIQISKQDVGVLIGKGGSSIRKIQKETNTRIAQRGERLENGDTVYTIRGTPDAVELAESKIKKHIMSRPLLSEFVMGVPDHCIGRIIGRCGETIRSIQDVTLTHITVDVQQPSIDENKFFTDDDYEAPKPEDGNVRKVTIRGTEQQIAHARQLIMDQVQQDATLRERILEGTRKRTPRMKKTEVNAENSNGTTVVPIRRDDMTLPLRQDKTLDVFVSCIYHPNELYIQLVNQDTPLLDELCTKMTHYYKSRSKEDGWSCEVGDLVAAPFSDDKYYRAKVLNLEGDTAQIFYIDFGDTGTVKLSELRQIKPEFLKLRFQGILATLNLECLEDKWTNESIDECIELTKCATWHQMKAKVLGYLKEPESTSDIIWIEIYDSQNKNIADELIRKGLAGLKTEQPHVPIATAPVILKFQNGASSTNGSSD